MEPLSQRSDEVLCALAGSGDRLAEEQLAARYSRLVRQCARPYFLAGGDGEDLIQEGMIGLLCAIRTYTPQREAGFSTYARVCIQNRLRSAVRAASREKHTPLNSSLSLGDAVLDGEVDRLESEGPRQESPEELLISREEREERMRGLRQTLSYFEKTVLELYLEGLSYREIAQRTGKSLKSVDNAVQRIRRKAAPYFGDISGS